MGILSTQQISRLIEPFFADADPALLERLSLYLDLLVKWNERTNLTAVRAPEQIVTRHFGESLFAARHLPYCENLLDLGSGAGFPGVPVQLVHPGVRVTLAESQNKKSAFLREVIRQLGLQSEVWAARVESMPTDRRFDVVAWRAVDKAEDALDAARARVAPGGWLVCLRSGEGDGGENFALPGERRMLHLKRT